MPFTIIRQDITKMTVDAIVNAANTELQMVGGVCGAIFNAAGADKLQAVCDNLAPIKTGQAVITSAFALPCKYIIHAAGPVYHSNDPKQSETLLRSAYTEAMKLAIENGCESIAFPLISSGIYGYPKDEALNVASSAIRDFIAENELDVYLTVFDKASFAISQELLGEIDSYIDENYVSKHRKNRREFLEVEREALADESAMPPMLMMNKCMAPKALDDLIGDLDEPFNTALLRLIDAKGKTDVEVYKKANIDRKLFSKIRTGNGYMPSKRTAVALAIALELSLPETDDLLERAGYALSHSQKFDVIIEYFILNKRYDVFEVNEVLFKYDQPLLGAN